MLDSVTMHGFVHPRVVKLMGVRPSQGAALTVIVVNGNQVLYRDLPELEITFQVEGGNCQVVVHSCLCVIEGL